MLLRNSPSVLKYGTIETLTNIPPLHFEVIPAYRECHFSAKTLEVVT